MKVYWIALMRCEIADKELRAMDANERYTSRNFDKAIHKAFRKIIQLIRSANDERDLRQFKSLRLEKLVGNRKGQHSMRLNDQFRLIILLQSDLHGQTAVVLEIADYH